MDFLTLCQTVRRECGIQGSGPTATTGQTGLLLRVVNWVISADLHIQEWHPDWDFLYQRSYTIDTVEGEDVLTKPTTLGQWDRTAFAFEKGTVNGRPLNFVDFVDWQADHSLKSNEEPTAITILPNGDLALRAPANGVHTLTLPYWKAPVTLSGDTTSPLFPARYHRAIVEKAKMWFFEDIESKLQWEQAREEFLAHLSKLESYALPEQQAASQSSPELIAVRSA